jgi:hypothetical protein
MQSENNPAAPFRGVAVLESQYSLESSWDAGRHRVGAAQIRQKQGRLVV